MEPRLRGILEKALDNLLSDDRRIISFTIFKKYKEETIIESIESAMFGAIFRKLLSIWSDFGPEDPRPGVDEFIGMIDSRSQIIKSRIREIASR